MPVLRDGLLKKPPSNVNMFILERPPFTFICGPPRASPICCEAFTFVTPGRILASPHYVPPVQRQIDYAPVVYQAG